MSMLSVIAHDKRMIPYRQELNQITGGVTSSILLQQLIYWWHRSEGKPFFKFIEPCGHDRYRDGDSWTEELGFSVKEFKTAYKRLEDAGLVSKKIGADRVTWYTLDEGLLTSMLEGLYINAERAMVNAERAVPVTAERAIHTTNRDYQEITPEIPHAPQDVGSTAVDLFAEFWASYPRKVAKQQALKAWAKLKVDADLFSRIMAGLEAQKNSSQWVKDGGAFIPHPATWLNGARWDDEVTPAKQSRHHGFDQRDYTQGLIDNGDGTYGF